MIHGIGINCFSDSLDGNRERLEADVCLAYQLGFAAYEFSVEAANVIRGGRIADNEIEQLKAIFARYPLRYTVHGPCTLRLTAATGWHTKIMVACLDVCKAIGADILVYHSAQIALRPADQDTEPLPDATVLRRLREEETAMLKDMAREAGERGVLIALENRDPHLWELAALVRHGKEPQDLLTYHAGMSLDVLVEQVQAVASPHLGICLDVGHAYLAAPYWPQPDILAAVDRAAPWIRHVHFHDNYGRLDDACDSLRERLVFGEADVHAPPGWGEIPLQGILDILLHHGYSGWLMVELRPRYGHHMAESLATVHRMLVAGGRH